MTMPLRESVVRRHVHSWTQKSVTRDDYSLTKSVRRECTDCREQQDATLVCWKYSWLPDSLLHLADDAWATVPTKRGSKP
jgi:hypothetical protein